MSRTSSHLQPLMIALFGIYLFIYPWSIALVSFNLVPVWGVWMGSALLILQGTVLGFWLTAYYGRHGALAALLILIVSWAIEHIGVLTGFPFGAYVYTDVLTPKIIQVVPLAIPFAWLLVVPAAVGVTERLFGNASIAAHSHGLRTLLKILVAATFATLLDVTIEPVAVHIKRYWIWNSGSSYYGVPLSNFGAWWVTSFVLVSVVYLCAGVRKARPRPLASPPVRTFDLRLPARFAGLSRYLSDLDWLPRTLYMLNLLMFMLVNLAHGMFSAAVIGALILAYLAFDLLEPGLLRWVLGARPRGVSPGSE